MRSILAIGIAAIVPLTAGAAAAEPTRAPQPRDSVKVRVETVAKGLANPWALQFLTDGRMLVTERPGTLRIVGKDGRVSAPIGGVPQVAAAGQGGLLDVALAPGLTPQGGTIFVSYSEPRGSGRNGTSVARARLVLSGDGARLEDVKVIFRQQPDIASSMHFGSRIAIARDGTLFVTLGERNSHRSEAQNPANHIGKVVHITADGAPAPGNPGTAGWAPEVWSIGHRNPQSAAIHPETGKLWIVEHGARGGDEINVPAAGRNYGWPVISYGREYSGGQIGVGTSKPGLEQPAYYWDPSIAPSGMAFYTAAQVPQWRGNLFVGALAGAHIARLVLSGEKVVAEEKLLAGLGERIRDVREGPDGALYALTDSSNGRILRVVPER